MKTLYLLRHAKSSWSDPAHADRERPLNERGREAAALMGRYLADQRPPPDYVLCSPAQRTKETLQCAAAAFDTPPPAEYPEVLYGGGISGYFEAVRALGPASEAALVIGHNPTMQAFALALSGNGDRDALARLAAKMPTAGLASVTFDIDVWSAVAPGRGRLAEFTVPKMLQS